MREAADVDDGPRNGLRLVREQERHDIGDVIASRGAAGCGAVRADAEPGAIATAIWEKGDRQSTEFTDAHPAMRHYREEIHGLLRVLTKTARSAIPADRAAEIAVRALLRRRAPARVLIGRDAKLLAFLRAALPLSWFDAILMHEYGIPRRKALP